jgi:uncharacterized protein (DUF924 family)
MLRRRNPFHRSRLESDMPIDDVPHLTAAVSREGFVEQEFYAGRDFSDRARQTEPATPDQVVAFWEEAGPALWFAKDPAFDRRFRETFRRAHEMAARGELDGWQTTPNGALALILLLDQFPRNAFRGTPRMYASDADARRIAVATVARGFDRRLPDQLRIFVYLPFAHSEDIADQDRSVALFRPIGEPGVSNSERHRDIVRRFGRFPHRNPILGRSMTAEEQEFLDQGGYAG